MQCSTVRRKLINVVRYLADFGDVRNGEGDVVLVNYAGWWCVTRNVAGRTKGMVSSASRC